ncbi:flagellar motor switch protein FliN [Ruicaihuangia caeni]|uniref:Flagellar motor switch protein FliN n=1 Tax=Ruicaihuangia caeni TaxID=3042517 RepID=A0AAW6T6B6_9MICO|nr:flagellar motor switch protein FliN [Klugiella sp. YN-L-19]MDI2097894.1 flagellar motor switch protein FliN [Klugiella sp. YN-L-19]
MSPTLTLHNDAADALVRLLPSTVPLQAVPVDDRGLVTQRAASAITADFVGTASARLAIVLAPEGDLAAIAGTTTPLVSSADVVRPALEAAAAVLGEGVLGEPASGDASDLIADPQTVLFELAAAGRPAGWFALRLREQPSPSPVRAVPSLDRLARIHNVEMALTVEIGRTRMSVRDVLGLEPGAVVELDRSAGAPADVLLNGRLIARGEIVVIDQDYAVRVTEILDTAETLS